MDRFDKLLVNAAINAYNALMGHAEEKTFVDDSVFTAFETARRAYNVDVVEAKIAHLFDMDKLEYCFNNVRDAKKAYDALTAEEKALVTNASVLEEKITALNELYGKTVDFNLTYAENLGEENQGGTDITPSDPLPGPRIETWVIVLIAVGGVLVLGGAVTVTVILIKRKRKTV